MGRKCRPGKPLIILVFSIISLWMAGCADSSLFGPDTQSSQVSFSQNASLSFRLKPLSKGGIDWGNIFRINLKLTGPTGWAQTGVLSNGGPEVLTFLAGGEGSHLIELWEVWTNLSGATNTNTNSASFNMRYGYNYLVWITVGSTNIEVLTNTNAVTFGLYSDSVPISVVWDTDTKLDIWDDPEDLIPLTLSVTDQTESTGEGANAWKMTGLAPEIFWIGMGIRVNPLAQTRDMRQFTNGSLNFQFRGTRPFKLGLKDGTGKQQWIRPLRMSHYGLRTNDSWCTVSIPLKIFDQIDLSQLQQYFMWFTDPTTGYTSNRTYYLDHIYYSDRFDGSMDNYIETNWGLYSESVENNVNFGYDTELAIWNNYASLTNDPVNPGDGPRSWKFTGTGPWMGFGLYVFPAGNVKNMSAYANGHLRFMYRATKAILKVGIESQGGKQVWVMNTALMRNYGMVTNGNWCSVSIPLSAFAGIDLSKMTEYFMWAQDSSSGYAVGDVVHFDNIYWSKD